MFKLILIRELDSMNTPFEFEKTISDYMAHRETVNKYGDEVSSSMDIFTRPLLYKENTESIAIVMYMDENASGAAQIGNQTILNYFNQLLGYCAQFNLPYSIYDNNTDRNTLMEVYKELDKLFPGGDVLTILSCAGVSDEEINNVILALRIDNSSPIDPIIGSMQDQNTVMNIVPSVTLDPSDDHSIYTESVSEYPAIDPVANSYGNNTPTPTITTSMDINSFINRIVDALGGKETKEEITIATSLDWVNHILFNKDKENVLDLSLVNEYRDKLITFTDELRASFIEKNVENEVVPETEVIEPKEETLEENDGLNVENHVREEVEDSSIPESIEESTATEDPVTESVNDNKEDYIYNIIDKSSEEDLFSVLLESAISDADLFNKIIENKKDLPNEILLESVSYNLYEKYKNGKNIRYGELSALNRKHLLDD